MENDQEFTDTTDSNIGFIVPDSQLDDEISQPTLITGLTTQKIQHSFLGENFMLDAHISSAASMSGKKAHACFHFSSTNESETDDQGIPLAADTVSDTSDVSRHETDKNVTVVERIPTKPEESPEFTKGMPPMSTPAQSMGSLQFSVRPMIVPETVDSYDEVAPTPDAFGSAPIVIPDSPCMDDDKDEEDEEDEEVSFRPVYPTVDTNYHLTAHTPLEQSDIKESQSLCLKFTPSQADILQMSDDEEAAEDNIVTEIISAKDVPSLNPGKDQTSVTELLPLILLEKPTLADSIEGSEESISVFRRVRSGNTTPQKQKLILDDSDEFLPVEGTKNLTKQKIYEKYSEKSVVSKLKSRKSHRKDMDNVDTISQQAGSHKFGGESGLVLMDKEKTHSSKKVTTVHGHKTPTGRAAHVGVKVSDDPISQHVDEDLTLSYDYTGSQNSPGLIDESIDVSVVPYQSSVELEKSAINKPSHIRSQEKPVTNVPSQIRSQEKPVTNKLSQIRSQEKPVTNMPSQIHSQERRDKQVHLSEESSFDSTTKQTTANKNNTIATADSEKLPSQSISQSEKNGQKFEQSHTNTVLFSIPTMSATKIKQEKKLYPSEEVESNNENRDELAKRRNISDGNRSKTDTGIFLDESSFGPYTGNKGEVSVVGKTIDLSTAARDTSTSFSKGVTYSDSTTLGQSRSVDLYTFEESQSHTIIDAPCLPKLRKSLGTAHQSRKKIVKRVRKVWRKRVKPKLEERKSSSTDDTSHLNQSRKPLKPRSEIVQRKLKKSVTTEQPNLEQRRDQQTQQQDQETAATAQTDFTSLQRKPKFNRPFDPPAAKSSASTSLELADPHTDRTQQLKKNGHTRGEDFPKQPKKSNSVTFLGGSHGEPSEISRELSDSSEHDVEKTTVQRIFTVVIAITEKTKVEIYNSKGKMIHQRESSVEVERTHLDPKVASEKVTERFITPQLSPSRSVSTVTTGDLADVSSSSLSRTYSSGSKVSNPSMDAVSSSQTLPTPAQRQHTLEVQDKEVLLQGSGTRPDSHLPTVINIPTSKVNQSRLSSASSNTGQDLFGTPNQSIIDHADSRTGKVISSSNSTPSSHSMISPIITVNKLDYDGQTKTSLHSDIAVSSELTADNVMRTAAIVSISEQQSSISHKQKSSLDEPMNDDCKQSEVPAKQAQSTTIGGKRSMKSDSQHDDEISDEQATPESSSKVGGKRRKVSHHEITGLKSSEQRKIPSGKAAVEKSKDDVVGSADIQSTGFSVHGVPPSATSGDSLKDPATAVSSKSSAGYSFSPEISLQGGVVKGATKMVVLKDYKSKAVTGAKVMGKWKDGYFYPGVISKVDPSNKKFMVKYCDGSQSVVKGSEIILAGELPVGQSVMVLTSSDFYEPGMVMGHSESREEEGSANLIYHVERDDGVTQMCEKKSIILSEGQAACLLSDEEMTVSPVALLLSAGKPADISLDNLVDGKRQPRSAKSSSNKDDQPSTSGMQSTSAQSSVSTIEGSEAGLSGRKHRMRPFATSTPTPKNTSKEGKRKGGPLKRLNPNPLGSVVVSPSSPSKSLRKARVGLSFESGAPKKTNLFEGIVFILTHVEKSSEERILENLLPEDSSLETSAEDNPFCESEPSSFVKEHLQSVIVKGGGRVVNSFEEIVLQAPKKCFMVAAEHQRTQKYLQALAAGMTIISHQWILHSAEQNQLQDLKSYILPAGISLEKKRLVEGSKGCSELARQTVMVVSGKQEFVDVWTSILNVAHSLVVTRFPARASKNDPGVDVVVSDNTCPPSIVRRCQQLGVPLVSSEWIAQCLITGRLVDASGNERYKYDFSP